MNLTAIVAVDKNNGIGKDGGLLAHLPSDLRFFKETTLGSTIIMGRKTAEGLPGGRLLPGRRTIILTRDEGYNKDGAVVVRTLDELEYALTPGEEAFVCGGGEIYKLLMPITDRCLITKIDADLGADTFFPDIESSGEFELLSEGLWQEELGVRFKFTEYIRVH
jgi:dihydrofolate reductase